MNEPAVEGRIVAIPGFLPYAPLNPVVALYYTQELIDGSKNFPYTGHSSQIASSRREISMPEIEGKLTFRPNLCYFIFP